MRDPELVPARRRRPFTGAIVLTAAVLSGAWVFAGIAAAQAIGGWTQAQGDAAHTGFLAEAAQPPYRESWHLEVSSEGPAAEFGLSQPVVDGSDVIAVGSTRIVAADVASGSELWTVDRDYGPAVAPAIGDLSGAHILVYTEGFGDSPPEATGTPSTEATGSASPSASPSDDGPFDSHLTAIDLDSHEPVWDASLQLDAVSRTGVTIESDTAYVGDNSGTVYAVDVATGEPRWTVDVGGFLTTSIAVEDDIVIVTVQGGRSVRPHLVALE